MADQSESRIFESWIEFYVPIRDKQNNHKVFIQYIVFFLV